MRLTQTELVTKRLEGKMAVIAGGNSGIGHVTAQRFVQKGAYVLITGRRQSKLDKAVKQIGKNVIGVQGDVSSRVFCSIMNKQQSLWMLNVYLCDLVSHEQEQWHESLVLRGISFWVILSNTALQVNRS